jgi:pathogenesis-related protein 1
MQNKIILGLLSTLFLSGCGSSDIEDYIKEKIKYDKGVVDDSGIVDTTVEDHISITGQEQEALDAHNDARDAVGVTNDLVWDAAIAADAQKYADEMANSGAWEHDPKNQGGYANGDYGENLYTSTQKPTLKTAADAWIDEEQYYSYGKVGDDSTCQQGQMCGHYTQVIWKSTSKMGCAMSKYKTGQYKNWYIVVCKYQTPGNYEGETPY